MSVSSTDPDWSRETPRRWWDPSRRLLRAIRRYQSAGFGLGGMLRRKYWALQHRFWSVITQAEIHLNTEIGSGLLLPHPNGIVIHPAVRTGPNCLIFQQVTLGAVPSRTGVPELGGHVDIGAGAKIVGPVAIGDHAVIAANAVVPVDVPAGAVVADVPARIVRQPLNTGEDK